MAYVVTQSCCADASCVVACPVNCIHPTPGEPDFAEAEMLYVDANSCVGCGACTTACPVDAILPVTVLDESQRPFIRLNAEYYDVFPHTDRRPLAVVAKQRRLRAFDFETPRAPRRWRAGRRRGSSISSLIARPSQAQSERARTFRVAVVGAGPAGLYTADELLRHPELQVDVYDKLPTPYGLVRAGVAPDHQSTKEVTRLFRAIEDQPGFRYFLGVEIGEDLSHEELTAQYHAVVYSVGAASDRSLGVAGERLAGSCSSTDLVGWYNGQPDKQDLVVPLDTERAVVVGNGNVALDVARILTADPEALAATDIATLPLSALRRSKVREVVVLGRRGPAQAAFTVPELIGLAGVGGLNVVIDSPVVPEAETTKGQVLAELAARPVDPALPTIVLRFLTSPVRILGEHHVSGIEVVRNRLELDADGVPRAVATGEIETLDCGLVVRAVGYHGQPVRNLPYDAATGIVPNDRGRVSTGVYVAGWVKRGPTGYIGTNKSCAQETVDRILDDLDAGPPRPVGTPESIASVVSGRQPDVVDLAGWRAIDAEERRRGADRGRPRVKIVDIDEMLRVAAPTGGPQRLRGARRRYAAVRSSEKRS